MTPASLPIAWSPDDGLAQDVRAASGPLEPVAFLDRIAAERAADAWLDLVQRSGEENPFFEPDILLPALRHFDRGGKVRIAMVAGRGGRLSALAPVRQGRLGRVSRALRVWTHDFGPLGAPLLDAAEAEQAASSLIAAAGRSALVMPYLPTKGAAAKAFRHAAGDGERTVQWLGVEKRAAIDRMASGPTDLRKALPTKRRKELARQMRRLGESGDLTFTTVRDTPDVRNAFEEFLKLEASGWKGRHGTALASDPHRLAFARDVVFRRSGEGGCHISALRLDGQPLAMLISFLGRSTVATWKIAYDERVARFSPGAQLMLEVGEHFLAAPEVQRVDSLATADHPMIDHLWSDRLALGTMVIAPERAGVVFRTGITTFQWEQRLRGLARRARDRLGRARNRETNS